MNGDDRTDRDVREDDSWEDDLDTLDEDDDLEEVDDLEGEDDDFDDDDEDDLDEDDDLDELDDLDDLDDDDDDFIDDATDEDVDFVMAAYREDGEPVVLPMVWDLANDLDELITQLRRLPGDAGALGAVSIAGEFFVLVRVRGRQVEVLLSDAMSANDWPIAHDVAEFLGVDAPEDEDELDTDYLGDVEIFKDLGISDIDMEAIVDEANDGSSEDAVSMAFEQLTFGPQFARALKADRPTFGGTR